MFTQPRDPNNKNKPAYKNIVPIVIEQTIPSLLVSKNNKMMKTKEDAFARSKSPYSLLYSIFVLHQTTEQKDMIHVIEVEVLHGIFITTKILIHKTDIALHSEIDLVMTRILLFHNILDHDMTTVKRFTILSLSLQIFLQVPL